MAVCRFSYLLMYGKYSVLNVSRDRTTNILRTVNFVKRIGAVLLKVRGRKVKVLQVMYLCLWALYLMANYLQLYGI